MITIRKSDDRGAANYGWLDTRYTFSFGDYYDERFMGFRDLRVINEDLIEPAQGFPQHGHRDMEIVTYMISGELAHKDSMGNSDTIRSNEVQRMTAGKGILHSEFSSETERTHLLQIWILPDETRLTPGYGQKGFAAQEKHNQLRRIASRGGSDGSVHINQDVSVYASILSKGAPVDLDLAPTRHAWIQLISGSIEVDGERLDPGDGAAISEEARVSILGLAESSELLAFDLR